ncbi:MAG: hypothetical protein IT406_00800 [Candidatus Yanofskybacteria bacterium]|nr:hypothetical protein [Candidatus Yanofskybacteria bacterium]
MAYSRPEVEMKKRYWLRLPGLPWREVSRERYIEVERNAGFRPKPGLEPPATAAFSNGIVAGTTTLGRKIPPVVLPVTCAKKADGGK